MGKSTTQNKSVEFDVEKIRRFTENELARLSDSPLPFCYQIGADQLIVGRFKVLKQDEKCWRVVDGDNQLFNFFNRKDAIFYCIALHKNDVSLANDIKDNDQMLGKLELDAIRFRHRYKTAQDNNDLWKEELYSNRYIETMAKIEYIKKQLKKSLSLAKYIKV